MERKPPKKVNNLNIFLIMIWVELLRYSLVHVFCWYLKLGSFNNPSDGHIIIISSVHCCGRNETDRLKIKNCDCVCVKVSVRSCHHSAKHHSQFHFVLFMHCLTSTNVGWAELSWAERIRFTLFGIDVRTNNNNWCTIWMFASMFCVCVR